MSSHFQSQTFVSFYLKKRYKNPSTGVKIIYETHHAYITIFLYRLINDEIIENPRIIDKNVELNCFALDDVLLLRNKASILKPAYEYGENSKYYDKENGFKTYVVIYQMVTFLYFRNLKKL